MKQTKSTTISKLICYPQFTQVEIRLTKGSDRAYEAHSHPTLSLGVMLEGQTLFHTPHGEFLLQKGAIAVIEPHIQHSCNPYKETKRSYLMVYIDRDLCLEKQCLFPLSTPLIYHKALHDEFVRIITALSQGYSPLHVKAFESWLASFFWLYSSSGTLKSVDANLQEIANFLENRMDESVSLDALSKRFNINPFVLLRRFKQAFGCTPKHYWLDMRIHHAKKLLQEGISLSLCAQYCGFVDQSHFHRFFKRRTALTPKEYQVNFIQ